MENVLVFAAIFILSIFLQQSYKEKCEEDKLTGITQHAIENSTRKDDIKKMVVTSFIVIVTTFIIIYSLKSLTN